MNTKAIISNIKNFLILPDDIRNELSKKNFSSFRYINLVIFFFCIINLIFFTIYYQFTKKIDIYRIIYFAGGIAYCIILFILIQFVKNKETGNYHIYKNILPYFSYIVALSFSLYNFFYLSNEFTGFLFFFIINIIGLIFFNFDPLHQNAFQIIPLIIMVPRIYHAYGIFGALDACSAYLLNIIVSLKKRALIIKNLDLLKKQVKEIKIKTFGNFTIFYKGNVLQFKRVKSLELIAYLVYKNGSGVNSKELMNVLWGDYATSTKYGSSLRNLIVDIKSTLRENGIENFFVSEYNNFRINPVIVDCDFYKVLDNEPGSKQSFFGEFMNQYSWAEDMIDFLNTKCNSKK